MALPACFWLQDWVPPINQRPIILEPTTIRVTTEMTRPEVLLTVMATDPDGDELTFDWSGFETHPYTRFETARSGDRYISIVKFDRDEKLEGRRIRCFVTDDPELDELSVVFDLKMP